MKTKNLGLYIHIPFCKKKCSYCDFFSKAYTDELGEKFTLSLITHIKEYANYTNGYIVDTLYIGGGTPSVLGYKNLVKIIKTIKKSFSLSKNIEITVELNPESTDLKLLKKLRSVSVNRLSFGVQSSNDENLLKLGRLHNFDTARHAVYLAKKAKFSNISIDLMYGLEGQTIDMLENDLVNFLALDVTHISTYSLKLEEGTKLFLDNPKLPDDDLVADMYDLICKTLNNAGFNHYEVSNFSKFNFHSKHNSKYWDLSEYLGIGPSAHSFFGNSRFSFVSDLDEYFKSHEIDEKDEVVPLKTRFGEYIMLKLRTSSGIDVDDFYKKFGVDFKIPEKFIKSGHANYKDGKFYLTEKGFFMSNYIINEIIN